MFGSNILEIAIGIIFIYLLASLACSAISEGISLVVNQRGRNLFAGIKNLLNDPNFTGLAQKVYYHGLVDGISQTRSNKTPRLPSYMASKTFALSLIDILSSDCVDESWQIHKDQKEEECKEAAEKYQACLEEDPKRDNLKKVYEDAQMGLAKAQIMLDKAAKLQAARNKLDEEAINDRGLKQYEKIQAQKVRLGKILQESRKLAAEYPDPLENIENTVRNLPDGHTKQSLLVLLDKTRRDANLAAGEVVTAEEKLDKLQENIEQWFNDSMDRVGGWYKRWTQWILFGIACVIVILGNVDSIMLIQRFHRDAALRASIVAAADNAIQTSTGDPTKDDQVRAQFLSNANELTLPLGWAIRTNDPYSSEQVPSCSPINSSCAVGWLTKLAGLLISVAAIQLGAPFWFDTLSKFVNIRAAGTPPGETSKSSPQPSRKSTQPVTIVLPASPQK